MPRTETFHLTMELLSNGYLVLAEHNEFEISREILARSEAHIQV
jgi:hypothetical protein